MSKAFTRENDDMEPEIPPARAEVPKGGRRLMTADGAERLRCEAAALEEQRLRLEETSGTDADARQELRRINARRQAIADILGRADVVANAEGPANELRFGLFVTIRHEDGAEDEYRLVGVDEVDPEGGSISWLSPLAQALMGGKVGDVVRFHAPVGEKILQIVRIRSRAGDVV